jgi:hypothetical protein
MFSGSIIAQRKSLDCLQAAESTMIQLEYLRKHIDALVALSYDVKDRAVSEKLREMADECRIMLSLADVTDVAAGLNKSAAVVPSDKYRIRPSALSSSWEPGGVEPSEKP